MRKLAYALILAALAATLVIDVVAMAHVPRSITSVPYWDEWAMIQEYRAVHQGQPLWPVLWSCYWGHRMVIGRLVFFADARWNSLASFTWLSLLVHFGHIAMMIALAWSIFRRASRACFLAACVVILDRMLSPDQMENFLWRNQFLYVLVFAAATASFLLLAAASRAQSRKRVALVVLSILAALLATYTMVNGLLIWPVLVVEAAYLRYRRGVTIGITALGTIVIGTYLWHYTRPPEEGMGILGALAHPIDAIWMLGLYLGGPLDFLSMRWGPVVAIVAVVASAWLALSAIRRARASEKPWLGALLAALLFLFLTGGSVVAGRLSPQFVEGLHGVFPIPGRYFTPINLFWTCVAMLVLYAAFVIQRRLAFLAIFTAFFAVFMFARVKAELVQAEDWADFFREADALGAAILLDVPDEQLLSRLWPNAPERNQLIGFLRQEKLSAFAEPRAGWFGQHLTDRFHIASPERCRGSVEAATPISSDRFHAWRFEGWAWDVQSARGPADIVFADESGRIVGSGRGQLRHGYYPGMPLTTALPPPSAEHASHRRSEWIGYARMDDSNAGGKIQTFAVLDGGREVCAIASTP